MILSLLVEELVLMLVDRLSQFLSLYHLGLGYLLLSLDVLLLVFLPLELVSL